jgi:hypothetical protein
MMYQFRGRKRRDEWTGRAIEGIRPLISLVWGWYNLGVLGVLRIILAVETFEANRLVRPLEYEQV